MTERVMSHQKFPTAPSRRMNPRMNAAPTEMPEAAEVNMSTWSPTRLERSETWLSPA